MWLYASQTLSMRLVLAGRSAALETERKTVDEILFRQDCILSHAVFLVFTRAWIS
jgi:hypothetical protein